MSQAIKEVSPLGIVKPGQRIPEWFDHQSKGEVLSFWVPGKFPAAAFASNYRGWEVLSFRVPGKFPAAAFASNYRGNKSIGMVPGTVPNQEAVFYLGCGPPKQLERKHRPGDNSTTKER